MAKITIVDDAENTLEINCHDDDLFQFLDLAGLAREHGLSKQVLCNRLTRRMPLIIALKTEKRSYSKK